MHFKERSFTNHRFTAVAFMFALAVAISLAMAAGAKAADSPIDNVEYIPASETIEVDTISSNLESNFMDDINPDTSIYALDQYSPQCWTKGLGTFDDNGVDLGNSSYGEDFLISTNDRLIITRKVCMIWVNEEKNEITNVVTEFDWDNIPPTEYNPYFDKDLTSIGTYKNNVIVTVNEFESDLPVWHVEKGPFTTFTKTIKITGYDLTKYDKKIPKVNYKKFGLGKGYAGDRYGCNFKITWPKVKNAVYYVAKVKLKKKTKYYFQITPYKTYKKVTYNGFTSEKKAAKTK